jgi:hypothetical protein
VYIQKLLQEGEEGGMGGHHTRVKLKGEREKVRGKSGLGVRLRADTVINPHYGWIGYCCEFRLWVDIVVSSD